MTLNINKVESTLEHTRRIIDNHEKLERAKGERFNIFAILKREYRENETHSAFISELLNPHGSHLMGTTFLDLFLKEIDCEDYIDSSTTKVIVEHVIGKKNINTAEGGRVDIYLEDKSGNAISIENKIYAQDQEKQVERYINYRKEQNRVYYLTLHGNEAPKDSTGNYREENGDYSILSYADNIVSWLIVCQQAAAEAPILRETIKQYLILIKKLTNKLSKGMQDDLDKVLQANIESARAISNRFWPMMNGYANSFLNDIIKETKSRLGDRYQVDLDSHFGKLHKDYQGFYISRTNNEWNGIRIKLEGDPNYFDNITTYGIVARDIDYNRIAIHSSLEHIDLLNEGFQSKEWYPYYKEIFNLSEEEQLKRLFEPKSNAKFRNEIVDKLVALVEVCDKPLSQDFSIIK